MHAFALSLLIIALLAQPLRAQTVHDTTIRMRDGILLEATITIPADTLPPGAFPGVILVHGYGGDKDDMQPLESVLASYGYSSLAYSVRGQGNSGGYSTTSGETERLDLDEVLQYYRKYPGIDPEKIGVAGGSQGGIHAWMAAAFQMEGVKAVAPTFATPHFAADLVPNNCIKQALAWQLSLSSVRYAPERELVRDLIVRDEYDSVLTYIYARDLERLLDSVQIPVLQGLGWNDALFPVNAGIRAVANLSARGIPVWSYYGANGHLAGYDFNELTFVIARSLDWFDHWLKGKALDQADIPLVFYGDDRPGWPHHVTDVWPPRPEGALRLHIGNGSLVPTLPGTSDSLLFSVRYDSSYTPRNGWEDRYGGVQFRNAFTSSPVRLLSPPLLDTADVTGIPLVHVVTASDASQFQAHARLFDVFRADTGLVWQLMTRGTNGLRGNTPPTRHSTDFECSALSHRIPPGHMIGLEITSLDVDAAGDAHIIPYFLTSHSLVYTSPSDPSYIDIPLVGSVSLAGVQDAVAVLPESFLLHQNYPNPFNPVTTIGYQISGVSDVMLVVYDLLGRQLAVLVDERKAPGSYAVSFDATGLSSGVYLYRLTAGSFAQTRKMIVVR